MTASDVRDRARSLADLPNSLVISSDDEINSLNESYHDVYQFITANDDDYYITEIVINLQASYLSPTNQAASEWWVPLPSDFLSLRYLDFNSNGQWLSIYKAPLSSRNIGPSEPQYRIRGAYLWIMGGFVLSAGSQLRLGYYPIPATITLPLPTLSFGTSYGRASFTNISDPFYTSLNQTMVYVYNATSIYSESISNNTVGTPIPIFTGAPGAISQLQYYKGYLYVLYSNNVYGAAGNLTSTLTFTQVTTSTDVTDFSIYKDTIYYTTATAVKSCNLLGGSINALQLALSAPLFPFTNGTNVYYVDSTGKLGMVGSTATIMSSVTNAYCNPSSQRVFLVSNNVLTTGSIASTSLGPLATISSDVLSLHMPEPNITTPQSDLDQSYWPLITRETGFLLAVGGQAPYEFSYPNNLFPELIAYQMAVDFRVKAAQDPSMLVGRLGSRDVTNQMTGLWLRMYQSLKRDDYNPERIANRYSEQYSGIW